MGIWSLCTSVEQNCLLLLKKTGKAVSGCRTLGEKSFHSLRPVAEKLLSPNLLCVWGTTNVQMLFYRVCTDPGKS